MEKYVLVVLFAGLFSSCSDGDLRIETIDFDGVSVEFCNAPQAVSSNIVFKINDDEALILELQSGVLNRGVIGETVITESAVPSQSQLTYRIFSDAVSTDYFCDDIPPPAPTVIEEIEAQDGLVTIETTADENNTNFVHTLRISDLSLIRENGERITDLTISEFGEISTAIPN